MFDRFELPDGHILRVSVAREKHRSAAPCTAKGYKDSTQSASMEPNMGSNSRYAAREAVGYRVKDELLPFSSQKKVKNNSETCQKAFREKRVGVLKRMNPKVSHGYPRRKTYQHASAFSSAKAAQRVSSARMTNVDRRRRGYIPQDELYSMNWTQSRAESIEKPSSTADEVTGVLERMIQTLENGMTILATESQNDTLEAYKRCKHTKMCLASDVGHAEDFLTEDLTSFIDSVSINSDSNKLGTGRTRSSCTMSRSDHASKRLKHEVLGSNHHKMHSADFDIESTSYTRRQNQDENVVEKSRKLQRTCSSIQPAPQEHPVNETSPSLRFIRRARDSSDESASPFLNRKKAGCKHPQASKHSASFELTDARDSCKKIRSETSTLFFVSSYKFTDQELEALFGAYNGLESIHRVKTFGRIKTMAYIKYSKPSEAQSVLDAFQEEAADSKDVIMKLTLAESKKENINRMVQVGSTDVQDASDTALPPDENSHPSSQWILVLHDQRIPKSIISSRISQYEKVESVQFQRPENKNTQCVAYAKFEDEQAAKQAMRDLHRSQIAPNDDGKYYELQAVLTAKPNMCNDTLQPSSVSSGLEYDSALAPKRRVAGFGKDEADLVAVETQFAHMMRNSGVGQYAPRNALAYETNPHNLLNPQEALPSSYSQQYSNYGPESCTFMGYRTPIAFSILDGLEACAYDPYFATPYEYVDTYYDPYGRPDPGWGEGPDTQLLDDTDTIDDEGSYVTASNSSVLIYASGPLQLASVAKLLESFTGVLALQKEKGTSFIEEETEFFPAFLVEFRDVEQANEASKELDQMTCCGQILRAQIVATYSNPNSSSQDVTEALNVRRNKRQRLDPRGRQQ